VIARTGHTIKQMPQPLHMSSSTTTAFPFSTLYVFFLVTGSATVSSNALTGQATTQLLQPVQTLPWISNAIAVILSTSHLVFVGFCMITYLFKGCCNPDKNLRLPIFLAGTLYLGLHFLYIFSLEPLSGHRPFISFCQIREIMTARMPPLSVGYHV
jgi:hypothetical protein